MEFVNDEKTALRAKIEEMLQNNRAHPVHSYNKAQALKIFKRSDACFATPKFDELLLQAIPLISAGFIRAKQEKYAHEEMLRKVQSMVSSADEAALAKGFVYGITHKDFREYILPFVAYHFFKNFPFHEKTARVGIESCCQICGYLDDTPLKSNREHERYHNFLDAFTDAEFLYRGKTYASYSVDFALYCLEEGARFPKVEPTKEDFATFLSAVRLAETVPLNKKIGEYRQRLYKSKILPLTNDETQEFINVLSYLNILHTKDFFGFAEVYTPPHEQKDSDESRNDYAYPVCHWRGEDGVDYHMIEKLFGKLECYQV